MSLSGVKDKTMTDNTFTTRRYTIDDCSMHERYLVTASVALHLAIVLCLGYLAFPMRK